MTRKGWLLDEKHASPICYKNWMSSVGLLGKLHDNLAINDLGSNETTDKFAIADFDVNSEHAYVQLAMAFKFNRRYDKLSQYISGQLCKDDDRLLYSDSDGVGHLERLTLTEKLNSKAGDNVRMFPRYDIMQKATKRNSSGVHTVPSRNQVKGIIEAKEDELLVYTDISGMELRGISAISQDPVMQKVFDDGIDLYTFAADAYYNGYKKLNMPYAEVRKKYRGAFKQGVISSIYTAGDYTLATGYDIQVHEVREVNKALFDNFQRLYDWQQEQINWNKANRTRIRTYLGDIRTTWEDNAKQTRQAVNLDVQGTCSLVATSGFNNLLKTATAKKMFLAPAVIVHDAIIAYAKASDIELIYDHYTENFLKFLGENYGFWFPFDIEIATNYYDKVLLSKKPEPRQYSVSGTNSSAFQVLDRCIKQGKKIKFLDEGVSLETIYSAINKNNHLYRQFHMGGGAVSFDRDFSYGSYNIEFID